VRRKRKEEVVVDSVDLFLRRWAQLVKAATLISI